jgi:hypothetical protein
MLESTNAIGSRACRDNDTLAACVCRLRRKGFLSTGEIEPELSVEILGHAVGGITCRHYAHRAPLALKAIMILPHPTAFAALVKGCDGECS